MAQTLDGDLVPLVILDDEPVSWFCRRCAQPLQMVIDATSGAVDWGADGDFGCADSPETDGEGSGDHSPTRDTSAVRAYWVRVARNGVAPMK